MQENVEGEADLVTADSHYWWERWLGPGNLDALMGPRAESSPKSWLSAQQSCLAFRDSLLPRDSRAWGVYGVTQLELCCFIYVCTVAWKRLWGAPRCGALSACRALPSAHEVPEQAARCSGAAGQPRPYCGLRGPESTEGGPPFRSDYDALCLIHFNGIFSPKAALLSKTLSLITMAIQLRYPRRGLPTS